MRRTELKRRTPLVSRSALRRSALPARAQAKKAIGLGQAVARLVGTHLQHKPKGPSVFRSEQHRKNVASLACVNCGRSSLRDGLYKSQAAHLNGVEFGKGMGVKVSDALLIPLCPDVFLRRGCHSLLDQGGVIDKATAVACQIDWLHKTRDELKRQNKWPQEAEDDMVRIVGAYLRRSML